MKRIRLIFVLTSSILILGLLFLSTGFTSAGWFSDIWNTITGNTITGNAISDSPQDLLVPLYEYYSSTASNHFYHTILDVDKYQNMGYDYIGIEAMVFSYNAEGTIPLYRLYSSSQNDHYYTTSDIEKENAVKNYGYRYEEITAYIYHYQESGTVPLYRLYSSSAQNHYYTTSIKERNMAINNYDYVDEVVVGYVYPGDVTEDDADKVISLDYHHIGQNWGTDSFLKRYHNQTVRQKVLSQLEQIKKDGFDRVSTRIWFVYNNNTANYDPNWRVRPGLGFSPVTAIHRLPYTEQELINIRQYTQDVSNQNLSLAFTLLFVYCNDYRMSFSSGLVGSSECRDNKITTTQFSQYLKQSVQDMLVKIEDIRGPDGKKVVEKIYLEGEVLISEGYSLSNGYKWLFKDSGLWEWFYNNVSSRGIEASTYFFITEPNANQLYVTLKWFKDNNLPIPDQIDFSFYMGGRKSDQYSSFINAVLNDVEIKTFSLFGKTVNYFVEETDYPTNEMDRFLIEKAYRSNFYKPNFIGVSFWQNSLDTTNAVSVPPFDIRILNNTADCFELLYDGIYSGINNKVGLSNGDSKFLCINTRLYECGWIADHPDFAQKATNGFIIGNYKCDLENSRWVVITTTCTSFTYSSWSTCSNGQQTRTVVSQSPSGCIGGNPVLSQSCTSPTNTCTSFTYSPWTTCNSSALQSKTILSQLPEGCTGGTPENLIQQCLPPCLESNWQPLVSPTPCPSSGQQTKTWDKIGTCNTSIVGSVNHLYPETISCEYIPPQCTDEDWDSSLSPIPCPSSEQQTKTWYKLNDCTGNARQTETISCEYNAPICTSFTYSDWGSCSILGKQSKTILSSLPENCQAGNPDNLIRDCTYIPPQCEDGDWSSSLSPTQCPSSGQQTKTWYKLNDCTGNARPTETISCEYIPPQCTDEDWDSSLSPIPCPSSGQQTKTWYKLNDCTGNARPTETISCEYNAPICTSFTYSDWGSCSILGKQSKTILSSLPENCQAGNPDNLIRDCTYNAPICESFTYSNWTNCSESNSRSRTILTYIPENCQAGNPVLSRNCTYNSPECNFTYSNWSECLPNGIQNRSLISVSPENCTSSNPELVRECHYVAPNTGKKGTGGNSGSNSPSNTIKHTQEESLKENNTDIKILNPIDAEEYRPTSVSLIKQFFCRFLNLFREDRDC